MTNSSAPISPNSQIYANYPDIDDDIDIEDVYASFIDAKSGFTRPVLPVQIYELVKDQLLKPRASAGGYFSYYDSVVEPVLAYYVSKHVKAQEDNIEIDDMKFEEPMEKDQDNELNIEEDDKDMKRPIDDTTVEEPEKEKAAEDEGGKMHAERANSPPKPEDEEDEVEVKEPPDDQGERKDEPKAYANAYIVTIDANFIK